MEKHCQNAKYSYFAKSQIQSWSISTALATFDCTVIDHSQSILLVQQSEQLPDMLTQRYTMQAAISTTVNYGTKLSQVLKCLKI